MINTFVSPRYRPVRVVYFFIVVILTSYFWLLSQKPDIFTAGFDSAEYLNIAHGINTYGFASIGMSVRTYGYPLFITLFSTPFPGTVQLDVIVFVQFLFHIATALLSIRVIRSLYQSEWNTAPPFIVEIVCFVLVQFNPVLLGLSREVLSDGLCAFFVTLFLWGLVSNSRLRYLAISLGLSIGAVIRPFHLAWGLGFLGLVVVAYIIQRIARDRRQVFSRLLRVKVLPVTFAAVQLLLPFLVIVGIQYNLTYQTEGAFNFVPKGDNDALDHELANSLSVYRYETYVGDLAPQGGLYYKDPYRFNMLSGTLVGGYVQDPLGLSYMTTVKTMSLFQNYEWSIYRQTTTNDANMIWFYGLLMAILLVYVNQWLILKWQIRLQQLVTPTFVLILGLDSYVLGYSLFTMSEPRYVAPVLPALTVLGLYRIVVDRQWRALLLAVIIGSLLYFIAYEVLLRTIVIP